ncbi:hypothetical protein C8J57DRAFT_1507303 [Mycena rebaudengoi]|nr:hypothetical protein C8J57DRAFT_1507303 [Mycena rebaudengoi]
MQPDVNVPIASRITPHSATILPASRNRSPSVEAVKEEEEIPARWTVSNVDTAYILDFSNDSRVKQESDGKKPKGFDQFLKKEDQDSYGKAHVHFRDGVSVTAKMILHPCTAQKIVYTSKDPNIPKCVVIFRGLLSHPPWPAEKPGHAAKEDVKRCMDAGGVLGETGGHLNNSHVTQVVLGSSIDIKHPAFRNTRRLREEVSKLESDGTPAGLLWADYKDDLKLPLAKRYVHHVHMSGETKTQLCFWLYAP